jgi:hypothetical protein
MSNYQERIDWLNANGGALSGQFVSITQTNSRYIDARTPMKLSHSEADTYHLRHVDLKESL